MFCVLEQIYCDDWFKISKTTVNCYFVSIISFTNKLWKKSADCSDLQGSGTSQIQSSSHRCLRLHPHLTWINFISWLVRQHWLLITTLETRFCKWGVLVPTGSEIIQGKVLNRKRHWPGITVMVFRARRTLKVLSAETFPKSTNSVRYLEHNKIHISSLLSYIHRHLCHHHHHHPHHLHYHHIYIIIIITILIIITIAIIFILILGIIFVVFVIVR